MSPAPAVVLDAVQAVLQTLEIGRWSTRDLDELLDALKRPPDRTTDSDRVRAEVRYGRGLWLRWWETPAGEPIASAGLALCIDSSPTPLDYDVCVHTFDFSGAPLTASARLP